MPRVHALGSAFYFLSCGFITSCIRIHVARCTDT